MSNPEPEEFLERELRVAARKRIEWRSIQGMALLGVAIGVATYLRETISPVFQVGVLGLLLLFAVCATAGLGAGVLAERFYS